MYKKNTKYKTSSHLASVFGLLIVACNAITSNAIAVGMGAAKAESYIGEQLDISIPIINIQDGENLTIELDQNTVSLFGSSPLVVQLENRGDDLFARVRSDYAVNEPYLSFTLNLSDDKSRSAKKFTVLLDLAPTEEALKNAEAAKRTVVGSSVTTSKPSSAGQRVGKSVAKYNTSNRTSNTLPSGSRTVAPGETLWGIARQASRGTDISINQMMVAIYKNNSSAFANGSIDLLKAGSALDIPDFESATQISSGSATQQMQALSSQRPARTSQLDLDGAIANAESQGEDRIADDSAIPAESSLSAEGSLPAEGSLSAEGSQPAEGFQTAEGSQPEDNASVEELFSADDLEQQLANEVDDGLVRSDGGQAGTFKLTGIAEAADGSSIGLQSSDPEAQEVIDSLAVTVGNLTQDIIAKEKQIQYLEDRIKALESYQLQEQAQANSVTSSIAASDQSESKNYLWWLLPLGVLALLALFFRDWIAGLFQPGRDQEMQFEPYEADMPRVNDEPFEAYQNERDYSVLSSRHAKPDDSADEDVEGVSFIEIKTSELDDDLKLDKDLKQDGEEEDDEPLFSDDEEHADTEELDELESEHVLNFNISDEFDADGNYDLSDTGAEQIVGLDDQLDEFLEERNFDSARKLLDSSKEVDLSEERYHFERLRLCLAMDDSDGFHDYYQEIKDKMAEFDEDVVAGIEGLVSSLDKQG